MPSSSSSSHKGVIIIHHEANIQHVFLRNWGSLELLALGDPVLVSLQNCPSHVVIFLHKCALNSGGEKWVTIGEASLAG